MQNNEQLDKELVVVKAQTTKALSAVGEIKIKTAEDVEKGKAVLAKIAELKRFIKGKKEGITKPMNEALKNVRNLFAPFEERIETAESEIKDKILDYTLKVQKEQEKKKAEIEEKVESGKMRFEKASEKIEAVEAKTASIPTRIIKDIEINEKEVPDEYWVIDTARIREDVLRLGKQVPGVKIIEKTIIVNQRSNY